MSNFKIKNIIAPLTWIVVFEVIAFGIGQITRMNIPTWYEGLEKSVLTPPNYVFPIVWTSMYVLIALAGWRIFTLRNEFDAKPALGAFIVYIILNWGWSFVFFAAHLIAPSFFWIVATFIANAMFVFLAWRVSKWASILMVPSLIWIGFAAYLNYAIWMLN